MDVIRWTWSKEGERLIKSRKKIKKVVPPIPPPSPKKIKSQSSLEEQIINNSHQSRFVEDNKREQTSKRLSQREWVGNRQINPFIKTNDYINDISVQDAFLRPKNSNFNVKNKDLNDS